MKIKPGTIVKTNTKGIFLVVLHDHGDLDFGNKIRAVGLSDIPYVSARGVIPICFDVKKGQWYMPPSIALLEPQVLKTLLPVAQLEENFTQSLSEDPKIFAMFKAILKN